MAAMSKVALTSGGRCNGLEAMLIYSMGVSVDGYIADREGRFEWTAPSEEQFRFHLAQISELRAAFADVWCAVPKVVFSHTLDSVEGNARLAEASVGEEVAAALDTTDKDVSIGGAGLAAAATAMARTTPPSDRSSPESGLNLRPLGPQPAYTTVRCVRVPKPVPNPRA
jgi:hypothetical protein